MDRYQRVEMPRPEEAIEENEIRITTRGLIRNYISYAILLLQDRGVGEIVLKAMGQAISKTVAIAEIIKKRVPGLHQDASISSVSITDVWEPIEEGLVPLEMTRYVSMISITLAGGELDKNSPGYQAPVFVEQPRQQPHQPAPPQQRQPRQPPPEYEGRGRGRGRGRGQRGRSYGGRGGYGGYGNNQGGYGGYDNQGGYGGYDNQGGYGGGYDNQGGYGGYGDNQGGYGYNQGRYGGYGNNQENGGYNNNPGRGGVRGRGTRNYHDGGYERDRVGGPGGRGYGGRGRGRTGGGGGGRGRGDNQA